MGSISGNGDKAEKSKFVRRYILPPTIGIKETLGECQDM
jgi:hypothetical protein